MLRSQLARARPGCEHGRDLMPQSHCTVGPSWRLRRTPDAKPGWTWVTQELNLVTPRWSGTLKKSFEMFETLVSRPGSPRYFRSGIAPGKHQQGTGITVKSPGPPGNILESVFSLLHQAGWPRWSWMLITVIQDRIGSPRFTRVHLPHMTGPPNSFTARGPVTLTAILFTQPAM